MSVDTEFWELVQPTGFCWEWLGGKNGRGYGQKQFGGRVQMAHRVAYNLLVGPIEPGRVLDHLCRNPMCVNPDHLEPVTQSLNVRRAPRVEQSRPQRYQTTCKRGHLFDAQNTYLHGGKRHCRQCRKEAKTRV